MGLPPHPGEFGYDTWPQEAYKKSGGVHNWSESTVDERRAIAFISFGSPRFDFYGGDRPGNNLFGDSLVALDARTGKRIWHYQLVHHDLWDYDLPQAPKLLTIRQNGRNIDVVAQATKQGFLFVFERETGRPIWPIEERSVPQSDVPGEHSSPTQPFPTKPAPFARQTFTMRSTAGSSLLFLSPPAPVCSLHALAGRAPQAAAPPPLPARSLHLILRPVPAEPVDLRAVHRVGVETVEEAAHA